MTSEPTMESKEIKSQVANHIRNLQMELESYQQQLKEKQNIARRATTQDDHSGNTGQQVANDAITRISISIMFLSDTITTYKKFSASYIPTGKVMVGSTLKVIDHKHSTTPYIKTYPIGLDNAKISTVSAATLLGAAVLDESKSAEVTMKAPLGCVPYYVEEVL